MGEGGWDGDSGVVEAGRTLRASRELGLARGTMSRPGVGGGQERAGRTKLWGREDGGVKN